MIPSYVTPVLVTGPVFPGPGSVFDVNVISPNPLPVIFSGGSVSTSTVTRVASSVTSHLLVAANPLRKGLLFYNDSTAYQYVKLGTVASGIDFTVRLVPQVFYEVALPLYLGQIDVISSSTNGAIQVTELS
jgi:hypothetical protein